MHIYFETKRGKKVKIKEASGRQLLDAFFRYRKLKDTKKIKRLNKELKEAECLQNESIEINGWRAVYTFMGTRFVIREKLIRARETPPPLYFAIKREVDKRGLIKDYLF